ncbi:hypothetical protein CAPTEDRAFT_22666, partial [Capitella teleta]
LPVPPDGGWGWVVVGSSFFLSLIVDGCCYSYGIFYMEYLAHFGASKAKTTLVGALLPGCYLLVGPFVSALANKYGCRIVCIIGSLISSFAFCISTLCTTIDQMIFLYGVLGGVGFGMMYLPSVVIVSFYFDRKRALATGLAVCGSGVGTFLFAPLCKWLLSIYGWKGANMILGGIILNGIVCASLYRPMEPPKQKKVKPSGDIRQSIIMQKIIQEKERQRTISTGSLNNTVITIDNKLIKDPDMLKKVQEIIISEEQNQLAAAQNNTIGGSTSNLTQPKTPENEERKLSLGSNSVEIKPVNKHLTRVQEDKHKVQFNHEEDSLLTASTMSLKKQKQKEKDDMNRPMYRQDIFYSGSVTSIVEYAQSNDDMTSYMASIASIPPPPPEDDHSCKAKCLPIFYVLQTIFDISLFGSPTFIVLLTGTGILAFTGFFTPFMYIVENAILLGVDENSATFLLSILGICNISGRLIAGWLADRNWTDSVLIHNIALILAGVATALVPLFTSYVMMVTYCIVFGSCIASFITLRSIVPVELLGLQRLTNSFGLMLLFQGAAALVGAPLSGFIYDVTQSYSISFVASGAMIAAGGL